MKNHKKSKIAFIGWNNFQLIHVHRLMENIPGSVFIFEKKRNSHLYINKKIINKANVPVIMYNSRDIYKIDNLYDVIVCQTTFTDIHRFKNAKIAMIQYGYAKEVHNYGTWRSFADICFTYGTYATKKIDYFCPTKEIGYLRHHDTNNPEFRQSALNKYKKILDSKKKTILYMPTWGELCSIKMYLDKILLLREDYNLLIKIHHNTDILDTKTKLKLKRTKPLNVLGLNSDSLELIVISDIVISDYSGAIFDAIYCKKPVILLNSEKAIKNAPDKIDKFSIEYKMREKLGKIINNPDELINSVNQYIINPVNFSEILYNELFSKNQHSYDNIYKELIDLTKKDKHLSQQQLYIRDTMRHYYKIRYSSLSSLSYQFYLDFLAYINITLLKYLP